MKRMKVQDLIDALSKEDPQAEVLYESDGVYGYIYGVSKTPDGVWLDTTPDEE